MPKFIQSDQEIPVNKVYSVEELLDSLSEGLEHLSPDRLGRTPPHILASFLSRLSVDDCRTVLRKVPELDASEILAEMDPEDSAEVVAAMREWRALKILEEFDPDDAADVIRELDEPDRVRLLGKLSPEIAKKVRALLQYEPDTAGGVMTPNFIWAYDDMNVDQAIEQIRKIRDEASHTTYVYVVDRKRKLKGVLSLRALILAAPKEMLSDIMETDLQGVCHSHEDKEKIAIAMAELNLFDLPVVDEKGRLLGIVEHDDVIDILQEEATEDFQKLVGAGGDEAIHDELFFSIKRRGPWLLVNLITAIFGAFVIAHFQLQIENLTLLAVLMPSIASLGGNAGAQTLAVAIRSLAVGELEVSDSMMICRREALKGLLGGAIIGLTAASVLYLFVRDIRLSIVFLLAMILNMGLGGLVGAFIPLMLRRLGLDPAQSSSIFLTATTDVCGFYIFLSLGAWLLF